MGDLGEALALMHSARHRYTSVRGTIRRSYDDPYHQQEAGGAPPQRVELSRLWAEDPDRVREENDDPLWAPELQVSVGEQRWAYHARSGVTIDAEVGHQAEDLLDPSPLLAQLRLFEPLGRATIAGRDAILLRGRDTSGDWGHSEPAELEFAVDRERGILLRLTAFARGRAQRTEEFVEVAFDESFPPETFVFTPPRRGPSVEPPLDPEQYAPREVTVEEAAGLAGFEVFVLDLPEDWLCYPTYTPEQPWPVSGPKPSYLADTVFVVYWLDDASHELHLTQRAAAGDDEVGGWEPREHDGRLVLVRAQPGSGTTVRLDRDGTRIELYSFTLTLEQLLQATRMLRRAPH